MNSELSDFSVGVVFTLLDSHMTQLRHSGVISTGVFLFGHHDYSIIQYRENDWVVVGLHGHGERDYRSALGLYYVLVSVSPWKRTWYRQRDKVDFITLLLITFHWLIETMLDHVTVIFSYATAIVLNLKTQYVNINNGFTVGTKNVLLTKFYIFKFIINRKQPSLLFSFTRSPSVKNSSPSRFALRWYVFTRVVWWLRTGTRVVFLLYTAQQTTTKLD